jgi:hypothetical protein
MIMSAEKTQGGIAMMMRFGVAAAFALLLMPAFAQQSGPNGGGGGGMGGGTVGPGAQMGTRSLTMDQFNQLQDYADLSRRLSKDDKAKGKTVEDLIKEDKAAAVAIATSMPLACTVDKAILAAEGPDTVDGKAVQTRTFETVCTNGMGYFLTSREAAPATGLTCFAADTTRSADVAAGRKPTPACGLPELGDIKAMATAVMTKAGTPCAVRDYRWLGSNSAAHVEFNEIACSDNTGYVLTVALPGSSSPVRVTTCHDSNARGLPCKLSDNGGEPLTAQTFRNALKQRGVACDADDKNVLIRGQETNLKRFVVEFKCSQHPQGLVGYIPLNGVKAPFEAVDCATAAKRGVKCSLSGSP